MDALAELAGAGPVLELGVGTGRLALALVERGLEVDGIDASEAMVAKLREKPGGDRVRVVLGDFAGVPAPGGPYPLVFVAFNTIYALLTQDEQVACFRGVAERLTPDGVFVVEAFVPDPSRFDRGQRVEAFRVETHEVDIHASTHDPVGQRVVFQHVVGGKDGLRLYPGSLRYIWPSEMDLMAAVAGLRLRSRHGGWRGEPFTTGSSRHVSVYERG